MNLDNQKVKVEYAGKVTVIRENCPREPYPHQLEAFKALDEKILVDSQSDYFAGLLVLPTGGGKTYTAVNWLLKNKIDKKHKLIWIAHRHALLDQACETFKYSAYQNILKSNPSFSFRILSGLHDKPIKIKDSDDIIISSKDSLNRGFEHLYNNWIEPNELEEIFLVIDEAHHATARTYRTLIKKLREKVGKLTVLGLTATPFRTVEKEKGLLQRVFKDDIIYKIDLTTLINRGILSEPIFESFNTEFDMTNALTATEIADVQKFDIEKIGKETADKIATNADRNNFIVNKYIENREKYKQTLVFALNVTNAIALNTLFNAKGIKSDFVVSDIRDKITNVVISTKENGEKIEKFKRGELSVLINVNILTEGTDIPNVQTVFLARPTKSSILMTQMIGRGLRGEKAGGTAQAFIVTFIDDWKDRISWVNPERLVYEDNIDFDDNSPENKKRLVRLISIAKIEEFARLADKTVNTSELEGLDFLQRIPVGFYIFDLVRLSEKDKEEVKRVEILIFDAIQQAYIDFINDLEDIFKWNAFNPYEEYIDEKTLETLAFDIEINYFSSCVEELGYNINDIKAILEYYHQYESQPPFVHFNERNLYDIDKIAKEIYDLGIGGIKKKEYIDQIWESNETQWKAFFGFEKKYFREEIDLATRKIEEPENYQKTDKKPIIVSELRDITELPLHEIKEKAPDYFRYLHNTIFNNAKDSEGNYVCAISGFKSKQKFRFQIDHIEPMSKGGLSIIENLQLLERKENAKKGDKTSNKKTPQEQLEEINEKLKSDEKNVEFFYDKANALIELEDYDNAILELEKALIQEPKNAKYLSRMGFAKALNNNIEEGLEDCNKALILEENGYVYFDLAYIYNLKEDDENTINFYTKVIELNNNWANSYNNRGDIYYKKEQYKLAIADYSKAIEIDDSEALYFGNRANAKRDSKDYKGALADYNKAINLGGNYYHERGWVKEQLKDLNGALKDYTKSIDLSHCAESYNNRGRIYYEQKKYQEAIEDYDKAIELDDTVDYYFSNRGDAKRDLKDYQGAIEDFTKAIELGGDYYHERAWIKSKKEILDYRGAIEDFTKSIELAEKPYYFTYYHRGKAYEKLELYAEAIADYEEADNLNPKNKQAREAKMKLLAKIN